MKQTTIFIIILLISILSNSCSREDIKIFNEIYSLTQQKDFFRAKEIYENNKNAISKKNKLFIQAILDNAFNKIERSELTIEHLINSGSLEDSLMFRLYEIQYDNSVKLYNYKTAKNTIKTILDSYNSFLNETERDNYYNSLKIWSALENTPSQKINLREYTYIQMEKDKAGLNTLKIRSNRDSLDFIFDTGANISTTTLSIAKRLNMEIIPMDLKVGTITGKKVLGQIAICDSMTLGNIDLFNVIFLVLEDEALSFPEHDYQIFGILGHPVIDALKEIWITRNGEFIVPLDETHFVTNSNMAMDGLTPLINLNNKHFTFDTGADETLLYQRYYNENRGVIDSIYKPQSISFGGAGGKKTFKGYVINYTINLSDEKQITLENIHLLKDKIKDSESVYGNVGQDLIQQFDTMILNFNKMQILFK